MDPVHRVSIVSRGSALGYTLIPPKKDRQHKTKSRLLETITSLLGGRAAEEMEFNDFTTGASSDIERATKIVRRMVIKYGMSELGPVNLGPMIDETEWGKAHLKPSEISDEMRSKVDKQISGIVEKAYQEAQAILKEHKDSLDEVVDALLEKETLEQEEFEEIVKNGKNNSN
jgi:cell division protease FtsH